MLHIHHPEYTSLHSGTHRKPSAAIGAPGLARNLNFWIPNDPTDRDGGIHSKRPNTKHTFAGRRQIWLNNVDSFIINIFHEISKVDRSFFHHLIDRTYNYYGNGNITLFNCNYVRTSSGWSRRPIFDSKDAKVQGEAFNPDHDILRDELPGRYETVSLYFYWHDLLVNMRFGMHNEYFSMSTFINLSQTLNNKQPASSLFNNISEHISKISEVCTKRYDDIASGDIARTTTWDTRSNNDRKSLIPAHDFLYTKIWEDFEHEIMDAAYTNKNDDLRYRIGFVYFDSRGILFHCPEGNENPFISPPFHTKSRRPLRENIGLDHDFDAVKATNHTDAALPFLAAKDPTEDTRIEYTVSRFLNKRVIYMTSLGAEHIDADRTHVPIKFLILSRSYHRWQLGRLVDRIFAMGSVRIAALMNLRILTKAGDDLRELTREVQTLLAETGEFSRKPGFSGIISDLRRRTAQLGTECDGGIEYRIERSRYYVEEYKQLSETFRMNRVEGFQRFDDFVRRRLFSTYDYIHRLGVRLERHRRDLEWVGQQAQIERSLATIRTSEKVQRNILTIQIIGEIFLMFPMIYYSSYILDIIFGIGPKLYIGMGGFWVMVCAILAAWHIWEYRRDGGSSSSGGSRTETTSESEPRVS